MPYPPLTASMRIPADLLVELGQFTGEFWSSWEQEPHICAAIRAYIKPLPAAQEQAAPSDTGYQWKELFLPAGTRLRASYRRQDDFATVEGNDIRCGGRSLSPSGFANLRGSGNRNAWRAVWLRFPGSPQWLLADACRALQQAAAARQFAAGETAAVPAAAAATETATATATATAAAPATAPTQAIAAATAATMAPVIAAAPAPATSAAPATAAAAATATATVPAAAPAGAAVTAIAVPHTITPTLHAAPAAPGKKKSRRGRRRKQRKHGAALKTPC